MAENTNIVPAICPQCGAQIKVDSQKEAAVCEYCNTPFVVDKAINTYNVGNTTVVNQAKRGALTAFFDYKKESDRLYHEGKEKSREFLRNNPEARRKNDRALRNIIILWGGIVLLLFLLLGVISCSDDKRRNQRLQQLQQNESQVLQSIKEEDYDTALFYANQLYVDDMGTDAKEEWDERRERYIRLIEEKKANSEQNNPST